MLPVKYLNNIINICFYGYIIFSIPIMIYYLIHIKRQLYFQLTLKSIKDDIDEKYQDNAEINNLYKDYKQSINDYTLNVKPFTNVYRCAAFAAITTIVVAWFTHSVFLGYTVIATAVATIALMIKEAIDAEYQWRKIQKISDKKLKKITTLL